MIGPETASSNQMSSITVEFLTMAVVNRQAQHHDGIMVITSERPAVSLSLVWKKPSNILPARLI